ncbi:MAG: Holliday junction branch migration DNA helicase RuvB [Nitrospira sp.]|nr:Holliday junction branch migration DNA helicase RuvB [Candidatus Manganitrophaceae bacterium]HIL35464.1 Holliday junction branch migration DNA helicase RuvB [Candidatus Manganitrophaceae bacterium]
MDDRIVTSQSTDEEQRVDSSLRPTSMEDYVGQEKIKENLKVYIQAAKNRGDVLDHVIFYGPPGLGKTTLANIIAREMGVNIKSTSGPAVEHPGDLAAILSNLSEGDIFFIDEIHRLHPTVEEILYPAMEDFQLDIIVGQGPTARTLKLNLPNFTLIGATTRAGLLTSPLRDRFGVISRLEFYQPEELRRIILRSASILNVSIDEEAALEIATRTRGTPRIANRVLRRVRDYAEVKADGHIDRTVAAQALTQMEIDSAGFDGMDRKLLLLIIQKFGGGPVGIETLATAVGEGKETLEDLYEPYLIQSGFLDRTPRGRMATDAAYAHFNLERPEVQPRLWK